MKILILLAFASVFVFSQSVQRFKNGSFEGSSFESSEKSTEFYELPENSKLLENSKIPENSNSEIVIKKYKKWQDLENEWEEKWEKIQK